MLKISEELFFLQTSLNQCLEDIRTSERKTIKELKDAMLNISKELSNVHSTDEKCRDSEQLIRIGTHGFAVPNVVTATVEDTVKTHVSHELRAQSDKIMEAIERVSDCVLGFCGSKEFPWYFNGWQTLKQKTSKKMFALELGPLLYLPGCRYRGCYGTSLLKKKSEQLNVGIYLSIVAGAKIFNAGMAL
ncbi:MAG: hypothetical protein O7D30_12920 [Rickettsia endosymbiont of Ixodes persulcatus]|nr:hypothetical protein [Rickettsia endosymbiont of Ixodes persulcatus]